MKLMKLQGTFGSSTGTNERSNTVQQMSDENNHGGNFTSVTSRKDKGCVDLL